MTERGDKVEKSSEGERQSQTSTNLAHEGVRDDEQAARYEPKFKSFSGHGGGQALESLGGRHAQQTDSTGGNDWLSTLIRRIGSSDGHESSRTVSEFVIEDKDGQKEHTASGERYIARPSYLDGLKAQVGDASSPQEAEQIQGLFSIEYILRKARDLGFAALSSFAPKEQEKVHVSEDPHATENDLRKHHNLPEAMVVAMGNAGLTDATPSAFSAVKPRPADAGAMFNNQFASPDDVLTVHRAGAAGKVFALLGVQDSPIQVEESLAQFIIDTVEARRKLVLTHPAAPPLICLDIEQSAVGTSTRPSVASVLAYKTGDYVLGKEANGDLRLFGPGGDELPYKITDAHSSEQWEKIREISTAHFAYNLGMTRNPDYRETIDAVTRAPADVVSISCHGVAGTPLKMTYDQLLETAKKTKQDRIFSQVKNHRSLHEPFILEVLSCDSAAGPLKGEGSLDAENSVAARIARDTQSWTIGFGSTVDSVTGETRESALALGTKGEPAVLFDPTGTPRDKFDTPLSVESWKKIRKYTETHSAR